MSRGGLEENIQTETAIGQFQKHINNNKYKQIMMTQLLQQIGEKKSTRYIIKSHSVLCGNEGHIQFSF